MKMVRPRPNRRRAQPMAAKLMVVPTEKEEEENLLADPRFKDLIQFVSEGCSVTHAASLAGLEMTQICLQLQQDKSCFNKPLLRLINKAKAAYYKRHIDRLNRAQDWKASAFWLERHEPEFQRDAALNQVNVAIVNGKATTEINLNPEHLERLSQAYDEEMRSKPVKASQKVISYPDTQKEEKPAGGHPDTKEA